MPRIHQYDNAQCEKAARLEPEHAREIARLKHAVQVTMFAENRLHDDEKDNFAETARQKIRQNANQEELTIDTSAEVVNNGTSETKEVKKESTIVNDDEPEEVYSESGVESDDLSQLGKQRPGF